MPLLSRLKRSFLRHPRGPGLVASMRYSLESGARPRVDAKDESRTITPFEPRQVYVEDMRSAAEPPTLDREGFTILPHKSRVRDFRDIAEVSSLYLDELEEVVRELTGCSRVYVLGHTILRGGRSALPGEPPREKHAGLIHSDYTPTSVWQAARAALRRYGVERDPEGPVVCYNLWRALTPPPQDPPLAVCDVRTLRARDLLVADAFRIPGNPEERMEFFFVKHATRHRWGYFPDMTRDELLIFKQYDGRRKISFGCPHVAFHDPCCPSDTPPRESIEARAFVFYP